MNARGIGAPSSEKPLLRFRKPQRENLECVGPPLGQGSLAALTSANQLASLDRFRAKKRCDDPF